MRCLRCSMGRPHFPAAYRLEMSSPASTGRWCAFPIPALVGLELRWTWRCPWVAAKGSGAAAGCRGGISPRLSEHGCGPPAGIAWWALPMRDIGEAKLVLDRCPRHEALRQAKAALRAMGEEIEDDEDEADDAEKAARDAPMRSRAERKRRTAKAADRKAARAARKAKADTTARQARRGSSGPLRRTRSRNDQTQAGATRGNARRRTDGCRSAANRLELLQIADAVAREKTIDPQHRHRRHEDASPRPRARATARRRTSTRDINPRTAQASCASRVTCWWWTRWRISPPRSRWTAPAATIRRRRWATIIADTLPPFDFGRIAAQSAKQVIVQ